MFTPEELLEMATIGGARALHIQAGTGTLEAGKRGDIQVLSSSSPLTSHGIAGSLLESARVNAVYLAGERIEL
jgi:cytosine/adenosine deaminase-related metal-dependent hydrolase